MSISRLSKTALRPVIGLRSPARLGLIAIGVRGVDSRQIQPKLPSGSRAFWSYIRGFAKSLYQPQPKEGQVPIANPDNDPRYSKEKKPIVIEVVAEPSEIETATAAWVTCGENKLKLKMFEKGYVGIYHNPMTKTWTVRWYANKHSPTFEEDKASGMPEQLVVGKASSLKSALRVGDTFAHKLFPHQFQYLSADANWFREPGTEKALDLLFDLLDIREDQQRPKELLVSGRKVAVKDLTKGQLYCLIQAAKQNRYANYDWENDGIEACAT